MMQQQVAGSKLGRSIFPLLLILLPLAVDGRAIRYPAAGAGTGSSFTEPASKPELARIPLEFPFPPGATTMAPPAGAASDLSLGDGEQPPVEDDQIAPARTSGARTPARSSGAATGPSAASEGDVDQPGVPALSVPVPDPGPAARGERATRQYRTYSPPPDRRTYSHPGAGPAGYDSTFDSGAATTPARGPTSSSVQQPPPPPPPPPPGQGSPGTFSPGEPGELAGFIG